MRRLVEMGGPVAGAGQVDAFDLDPDMVEQARVRFVADKPSG